MLSFRRALIIAAFVLTALYFLRSSGSTQSVQPIPTRDRVFHEADTATKGQTTGYADAKYSASRVASGGQKSNPGGQQALGKPVGKTLQEKLAYQFPYAIEEKFPAYIWQTWKYTPASGDFSDKFREAEASWTEKHPTFIHEVITDAVAAHLIRYLYSTLPDVVDAYNALPLPILKADFFRYLILLARGGIYTDIDTYAIKSAVEWVPEWVNRSTFGLVIGIEADPDREDWAQWYSRRIQFCQWTIQAKAGHPVLREIVAAITKETLKRKKTGTLKKDQKGIVEFTGPALWTDILFKYFNDEKYFDMKTGKGNITYERFTGMKNPKQIGDVVVLPITGFSPGVGQMGSEEPDHPSACVKHDFEGTWKPEEERHIGDPK